MIVPYGPYNRYSYKWEVLSERLKDMMTSYTEDMKLKLRTLKERAKKITKIYKKCNYFTILKRELLYMHYRPHEMSRICPEWC